MPQMNTLLFTLYSKGSNHMETGVNRIWLQLYTQWILNILGSSWTSNMPCYWCEAPKCTSHCQRQLQRISISSFRPAYIVHLVPSTAGNVTAPYLETGPALILYGHKLKCISNLECNISILSALIWCVHPQVLTTVDLCVVVKFAKGTTWGRRCFVKFWVN